MADEVSIRTYTYEVSVGPDYYEVEVRSQVQYVVEILGGGGSGTDANAIHINVADEFDTASQKLVPVDADRVLLEDSEDGLAKKYAELGDLPGGGSGETNTASSAGSGLSLYYTKAGVDLQFNAIKSENDRLSLALDAVTHDIELTLVEGNIVHQNLSGAGTNTHAQIDTHIANATLHFTEASIDHANIQNIGTNTHAQIDTHIASTANPHSVTAAQVGNTTAQWNANQIQGSAVTITAIGNDEILVYSAGTWINQTLAEAGIAAASHTHAASDVVSGTFADARISETSVTQHEAAIDHDALLNFVAAEHFTVASIDHTLILNVGTNTHVQIDTHIANTANPHSVTAAQVGNTTAQWNADKVQGADVTITAITDNEILVYESGAGDWVNQTYAEAGISEVGHTHAASAIISGTFADARISESSVTQHESAIDHDQLTNFVAGEHFTQASITTVGTIGTGVWQGTTIDELYGGTGFNTYATGDILYASATNTLSKLAAGSDYDYLRLSSSGVPEWQTRDDVWGFTILSPNGGDDVTLIRLPYNITITEIRGVVVGTSTPSQGMRFYYGSDRSSAGTAITPLQATSSTTTGTVYTISVANISSGNWIWVDTSTPTGNVDQVHVTIKYKRNG